MPKNLHHALIPISRPSSAMVSKATLRLPTTKAEVFSYVSQKRINPKRENIMTASHAGYWNANNSLTKASKQLRGNKSFNSRLCYSFHINYFGNIFWKTRLAYG